MRTAIIARLAPHIARPGGGPFGWLALQLMLRRNRAMNEWAIALLDIQPTDRVLELGFGAGASIQRAANLATQGHIAGIDHAADALRRASRRNRAAIQAGRVDLRQGDVHALPFPDAAYDKAFCCGLVYYLHDLVAALREVWRVLTPGGLFAVMARRPEILAQNPVFMQGDHHRYSGAELCDLLTTAGFSRVWLADDPPDPTVLAALGTRGG
jgi:ubiquinone/menaquinone biosynthesis C-methylase UbiE